MLGGDVGNGLGDGHRDVSEDEPDQNPIDSAGRGLPAAPVLEDLERALAESQTVWPVVHRWSHHRQNAIAARESATGFPAQREF